MICGFLNQMIFIYFRSCYSGTSKKRRAKGLAKYVWYNEVCFIGFLFHILYYWGEEYRSIKRKIIVQFQSRVLYS